MSLCYVTYAKLCYNNHARIDYKMKIILHMDSLKEL